MTIRALLACLLLSAACSRNHELAKCGGPAAPLNAGKWTPTEQQKAEMDRLVKEACR